MAIVLDGTAGITTPALDSVAKITPADLGTGTPDSTNFLRGDGSWQTISTTPTTEQVLTATAGASVGAVGTYAFLVPGAAASSPNDQPILPGATWAGSSLRYANAAGNDGSGSANGGSSWNANNNGIFLNAGDAPAGTWRLMGFINDLNIGTTQRQYKSSLWLRIS